MGNRKSVRASSVLFRQGDEPEGVYMVIAGKVRLIIRNPETQVITFDRPAEPGSLLGLPAVFADRPYSMTAEVLEDSEVAYIGRSRFLAMMQADNLLCMRCLQLLSDEVRIARGAIKTSG